MAETSEFDECEEECAEAQEEQPDRSIGDGDDDAERDQHGKAEKNAGGSQ